jgi:hypothetical protein
MSWPTMAIASHSNRSTAMTHECACSVLSSTCLQLTGGDGEPGEPGNPSLAIPKFATPKDPGG